MENKHTKKEKKGNLGTQEDKNLNAQIKN